MYVFEERETCRICGVSVIVFNFYQHTIMCQKYTKLNAEFIYSSDLMIMECKKFKKQKILFKSKCLQRLNLSDKWSKSDKISNWEFMKTMIDSGQQGLFYFEVYKELIQVLLNIKDYLKRMKISPSNQKNEVFIKNRMQTSLRIIKKMIPDLSITMQLKSVYKIVSKRNTMINELGRLKK